MLVMMLVMIMVTMMVMMVVMMMMMKMMMREHKYFPSMACLIDVCFGGKSFAVDGWNARRAHSSQTGWHREPSARCDACQAASYEFNAFSHDFRIFFEFNAFSHDELMMRISEMIMS